MPLYGGIDLHANNSVYHLKNSRLEVHALAGCHNEGKWA